MGPTEGVGVGGSVIRGVGEAVIEGMGVSVGMGEAASARSLTDRMFRETMGT